MCRRATFGAFSLAATVVINLLAACTDTTGSILVDAASDSDASPLLRKGMPSHEAQRLEAQVRIEGQANGDGGPNHSFSLRHEGDESTNIATFRTTDATSTGSTAYKFDVVRETKRYRRNVKKFARVVRNREYRMRISNDGGNRFRRVEVTMGTGTKGLPRRSLFRKVWRLLRTYDGSTSMRSFNIVYSRKYGFPREISYEYIKQSVRAKLFEERVGSSPRDSSLRLLTVAP